MPHDISLIALLAFATLVPFLVASGTCYIKFSIVFVMVRNSLGLQGVPSNLTLNGVALLLSMFVMMPVTKQAYNYYESEHVQFDSVQSVSDFIDGGLGSYRDYLTRYTDPDLANFFEKVQKDRIDNKDEAADDDPDAKPSIFSLLPAYALSEIKSAFQIGFYLYLPFVVVDLVISSILLALGMMMMSPVTISVPVKLILFVAMDGWALLSKGLIMQYISLAST